MPRNKPTAILPKRRSIKASSPITTDDMTNQDTMPMEERKPSPYMVLEQYSIHPFADAYALINEFRLTDMMESILANGQRRPIITDIDGRIIDGRNRLIACHMGSVEPRFERMNFPNDEAIVSFIIDENSVRRDITDSQRTLAYAILNPTDRRRSGSASVRITDDKSKQINSNMRLTNARKLVAAQADPDVGISGLAKWLIDDVKHGNKSIEDAIKELNGEYSAKRGKGEKMGEMHIRSPDLAEKVLKGQMAYKDAVQLYETKEKETRSIIDAGIKAAKQSLMDFESSVYTILTAINLLDDGKGRPGEAIAIISTDMMSRVEDAASTLRELYERTTYKGSK